MAGTGDAAAAAAACAFKLRALSFNVWAVPYVGVQTDFRVDALMKHLVAAEQNSNGKGVYDIIGFQEVFSPFAIERLHNDLPKAGLPYIMHFISGSDMPSLANGSGLMIASRYPILDTAWHIYSAGGRPYKISQVRLTP
jgi:hypothetical protein